MRQAFGNHTFPEEFGSTPGSSIAKFLNAYALNVNNRNSEYHDGKYVPSIICRTPLDSKKYADGVCLVYLFDGKIRDCIHPFMVSREVVSPELSIIALNYFSTERLQMGKPIVVEIIHRERDSVVHKHYSNPDMTGTYTETEDYDDDRNPFDINGNFTHDEMLRSKITFAE